MKNIRFTCVFFSLCLVCLPSDISAQKKERFYTSSFYSHSVKPVSNILIQYRAELFTKKSFEKFKSRLLKNCSKHGVKVDFAVIGSIEEDSLRNIAEFVCKINGMKYVSNVVGPSIANQMVMNSWFGSGKKNFSILGFQDIYSGIPVWKCFCNLETSMNDEADEEAAECFYKRLVRDGIIE